jgi:hypothetical protein
VIAALALLGCLQAPPTVTARPGEATDKAWTIVGKADMPQGTTLAAAAIRIERLWDPKAKQFLEVVSETVGVRGSAYVEKKAFTVHLTPATPGLYQISVSDDEQRLFDARVPFGAIDRLFAASPDHVKRLVEAVDRARDFLAEVQRLSVDDKAPPPKAFDDFQTRVSRQEAAIVEAASRTDLTATAGVLTDIYYHLRNAQVWSREQGPPDDDETVARRVFLDPDLTLEKLGAQIGTVKGILSLEIRASIAMLLDELFGVGLAAGREAAKPALTLAKTAPEQDEAFLKLLEAAAKAEDAASERAGFQEVRGKLVGK